MASEAHMVGGSDETTGAIYEVIRTMGGGEESPPEHESPAAIPEVGDTTLNWGVEDELLEAGVFTNRRTDTQRRVLGCLACSLNARPGDEGRCLPIDVAICRGNRYQNTKAVLDKLVGAGLLETTYSYEMEDFDVRGLRPRVSRAYKYTAAALRSGLKERLETPRECGLEAGRQRVQAQEEAERQAAEARANTPAAKMDPVRAALGCLMCRLNAGKPGVQAQEVAACKGLDRTKVQKALSSMADHGVLQNGAEVYTLPEATELSTLLRSTVAAPKQCGLKHNYTQGDIYG